MRFRGYILYYYATINMLGFSVRLDLVSHRRSVRTHGFEHTPRDDCPYPSLPYARSFLVVILNKGHLNSDQLTLPSMHDATPSAIEFHGEERYLLVRRRGSCACSLIRQCRRVV